MGVEVDCVRVNAKVMPCNAMHWQAKTRSLGPANRQAEAQGVVVCGRAKGGSQEEGVMHVPAVAVRCRYGGGGGGGGGVGGMQMCSSSSKS